MRRTALSTMLGLALAGNATAQLTYDAGTAGNPPTAPSPATQGWTEAITGTVTVGDVSPDPNAPLNAWQITDTGAGQGRYSFSVFSMPDDWEVRVTMRVLGGSVFLEIGTGDLITDSWYQIELETVENDVLLHRPNGSPLFCAGGADGDYHEFRFTVDQISSLAWYDGDVLGWVDETDWGFRNFNGLSFGTGDGAGRVRFHEVILGPTGSTWLRDGGACFTNAPNSTGSRGAIFVVGSDVVTDDDLTLVARYLPPSPNIGYFLMGTGQNTFTPPGSASPICIAPGLLRYLPPVENTTELEGGFWRTVGTTGPVSGAITAGSTWGFQAWHRDGGNPSNLTNATFVSFQ